MRWRSGTAPRRTLILARDRLGQKPWFTTTTVGRLVFASELKALLALPEQHRAAATSIPLALDHYLCYGYVPHPRTMLDGTYKLPPAHYAVWHGGTLTDRALLGPRLERRTRAVQSRKTSKSCARRLSDAVREQMIADVPLGAFLSGGHRFDDRRRPHAAAIEPAGQDVRDWLSRPEV